MPRPEVRPATSRIRDLLTVSEEFEAYVGRELTVNPTDLLAMEHLIQDGPLTPTDLSRRLGVSTAATTTIIDRLTAVGHVERVPNPNDRRGILVVPAPASVERAMGAIMPMVMGIDRVLNDFSDEQKAIITDYLSRVVEVYRAQLPTASKS